jgi:hypothetical protein
VSRLTRTCCLAKEGSKDERKGRTFPSSTFPTSTSHFSLTSLATDAALGRSPALCDSSESRAALSRKHGSLPPPLPPHSPSSPSNALISVFIGPRYIPEDRRNAVVPSQEAALLPVVFLRPTARLQPSLEPFPLLLRSHKDPTPPSTSLGRSKPLNVSPQPLLQPGAHPELAFLAFFLAFLLSSRPTSTVTTSTASYSASRRRLQHLASPPLRALARQRSSELSHCRSSFPPTSQDATLGRSPICSSTTPTFRDPDPVLFQHPPVFPAPSFRQERRCGRLLRPPLRLPSVSELSTSAEHFQHRRPVHLSASALVFSLLVVDEVVCFHLLSSPSHCSVETADQLVAKERQWERLGCDSFVSHHWRPKEVGKRSEER